MADPYVPGIVSDEYDPQQVQYELERIASALAEYTGNVIILTPQAITPERPSEGMLANADGANWDPGSGEGFYRYISSAWEKLSGGAAAAGDAWLYKAADTTRNNTTTLTADPDLATTLDANSFYTIHGHVLFEAHATPDFAYNFTEPDGTYQIVLYKADEVSSTVGVEAIFESFGGNSVAMNGIGTTHWVSFLGAIQTGGAGGTFSFDWSQNTSSAEDTILMAGSWMHLRKLN